jgi:NADH:ubiquinone oxidoreductase subunit E
MVTVTVCVGSSCHIKGAREVIMRFNELLKERDLEDKVELKGSFCMERCGEGINWQINDEPLISSTVEDALKTFMSKIVEPIDTLEI